MRLTLAVIWVCCGVLISGCATSYQHKGATGGFSETQLSENTFRVYFNGNGYTHRERAEDFTLLRSADIALEHGYPYFIIVDGNSASDVVGTLQMPTQSNATATATSFGNTAYGTAHTTTSGGHSFFIRKPSVENTIVCFKEKPDVQGPVYEAKFVSHSIRSKYGMKD